MWPFRKKLRQRRLEVRKNIPSTRGTVWRCFVQARGPVGLLIALAFFVLASLLVIFPTRIGLYRVGEYLPSNVYAHVSFEAPSDEATRQAQEAAASQTPPTLNANQALFTDIDTTLRALPRQLAEYPAQDKVPADLRDQFNIKTDADLQNLRQFAQAPKADSYQAAVGQAEANLAKQVIIPDEDNRKYSGAARAFRLVTPSGPASAMRFESLVLNRESYPLIRERLAQVVAPLDPSIRGNVLNYLDKLIIAKARPTYRINQAKTEADMNEARAAVPVQMMSYPADSLIVKGQRTLTADDVQLLQAERAAYVKALKDPTSAVYDPSRMVRAAVGRMGMVLLLTAVLCLYVAKYQPRVVRNPWRGVGLAALLLGMVAIGELITVVPGWDPYLAVATVIAGAVIITIAYDQRFALAVGAILAFLTSLSLSMWMGLGYFLALLTGAAVNVFQLKEIRSRSKLVEVGATAAVCVFVAASLVQLAQSSPLNGELIKNSLWGAGAALLVGFFIQGVLPGIERTFRIATSMTLLEWSDPNKKLLKRLAIDSPGTYNHSILLGTLCEAAAEAIGARGLLARVGAYYHDIGKINKPEYFIENQLGSPSKHAKLSPAMSLLIIVGHVKDGIELAREYNLPPVLHEFIATHHGTTLVQYFYHAATEQRRAAGSERAPEEVEFRYPGPKPHSKEAAILMLADAVESSVRAMSDPTAARIETQTHSIVTARLMDGQFDECDLTLREVHEIEKSLVKSLQGIYHGRIAYPKAPPKGESESEPKVAGA